MICLISFNKFSDKLHAFTCPSAIGNLCLGVNVFNLFPSFSFIGNVPLLKVLRIYSRPS